MNKSLKDDSKTYRRLELNTQRNKKQDNGPELDQLSLKFSYEACKDQYWNPEPFSLLYKTPLWEQSSLSQRIKLNQLYWVAYYSQIISAEIATIFFNQTSAASLYGMEDFRVVCDTLDLESMQERAHINAFKKVSEDFETAVFGKRVFTYPMRTPYVETMVYHDTNRAKEFWKKLQLYGFTLLSANYAFIGCQYFTVRGLRTLNGKIVQHALSQYYSKGLYKAPEDSQAVAPIPSLISYYHFLDESFHFNSSLVISHDVIRSLKAPTPFEKWVANKMLWGCQKDHYNFSTAINGIFWYDPALYETIYQVLRSNIFSMDSEEALQMMDRCFSQESEGMHLSAATHRTAQASYREYLGKVDYVSRANKDLALMARNSVEQHLRGNANAMKRFQAQKRKLGDHSTPVLLKNPSNEKVALGEAV